MSKKIKIADLLTLLSSLSLIFGFVTDFNRVEASNETSFHGIKAEPFENRYSISDLTGEPKSSDFFSYNYRYMGTGGSTLASSSIWENYRGETSSGDPVVVAVIDSGIDIFHEDFITKDGLGKKLTFDNITQYSTLHPKSAYIYDKTGNGDHTYDVVTEVGIVKAYDTDIYDSKNYIYYSHGTAVASTIASSINGKGGFGVAPLAQIMFIKMDFFFVSIDVAIRYAADNGADVINLSFGAYSKTFTDGSGKTHIGEASVATALTSAIDYAHSKDVVVVAAAGNEDTSEKSYPACNGGVIGVGALGKNQSSVPASYTNYNSSTDSYSGNNNVDVVAPGSVYTAQYPQKAAREYGSSAIADSYYSQTQGTSFASPLTAGAIALYRGAHPGDKRSKVIDELINSCDDIGDSGWDKQYGYGRVNLTEFVNTGIAVTKVNVTPSTKTLTMTNQDPSPTVQLSASFLPTNAADEYKEGLWVSNDENVATVDENTGLVTAVGAGQTDVCFITERDMIEGYATITVNDNIERNVTGISLDQTSMVVGLNKTRELTATISPANATNQNINWTTSDPSVATVDNGVVTGVALGEALITATTQDGGYKATCNVSVEEIQGGSFTINRDSHTGTEAYGWHSWTATTNGILISGYSYIFGGEKSKLQFHNEREYYYIYNKDEVPTDITSITIKLNSSTTKSEAKKWSVRTNTSSFGQVITGIPEDGGTYYSAQTISTEGTTFNINGGTYFAICYEGSGASYLDSVIVEYGGGSTVNDSVTLDKTSLELSIDETAQLTATATGEVSWESDNTSVATVSDSGLVSAKSAGDATITATCGTASATCEVVVLANTQNPGDIDPIEPDIPTCEEGYTLVKDATKLKAEDKVVIAASGSNKALGTTQNNNNRSAVNVTKSDDSLTFATSVDELTLKNGKTSGTFAFYSSSNTGYLYAASSSSNYLRTEATLSENSSWSISITSQGVATIQAQGTNTNNSLRYNSNSNIFSCYSNGQAAIAIYKYIDAPEVEPKSVTISPSPLSLDLYNKKTATLTASVAPKDSAQEVVWSSLNEDVATVSDTGVVTALKTGTATIKATCQNNSSIYGTCDVTISDSTPAPVSVSGIELSGNFDNAYSGEDLNNYDKFISLDVYNNKQQQINASVLPSDASNKTLSWSSDNTSIVTVSNGLLTAKGEGYTVVRVSSTDGSNIVKTIKVTVTNETPVLSSITLSNVPTTVPWKGELDTSGIIVTAHYTYGDSKTVTATFSGLNTSSIGEKEVVATYTEGEITKTASFEVFVTNKDAVRTEIPGVSSTYNSGDFGTSNTNTFTSNGEKVNINGKGKNWTLNTDGAYFGYDNNNGKGAQIGSSSNPATTVTISSNDFSETITQVTVNASTASKGNCSIKVKVGGVFFTPNPQTLSDSSKTYTFTGSAKGTIEIVYTNLANKAVYFKNVTVLSAAPGGYDWNGDDQATVYVNYLKTFSSCASSWTDRADIVRLVNEFNYMIQEAKDSSILLNSFVDNGYTTTAIEKLKMIVDQYNKTLETGETALALVLAVDEVGDPLLTYNGDKKFESLLNFNNFNIFALLGIAMIMLSSLIILKKIRKINYINLNDKN